MMIDVRLNGWLKRASSHSLVPRPAGGAQNWLVTPSPALAGPCPEAESDAPKPSGMNGTGLLVFPRSGALSGAITVRPGPTAPAPTPAATTSADTHLTQPRLRRGTGRSPAS